MSRRLRALVLALALLSLFGCARRPPRPPRATGTLRVSAIDVGQGDSLLVQFPDGETMLVDAGEREAGPKVVRYLESQGVTHIERLVATHPHADHIGGMEEVLNTFAVARVWDSGYVHGSRTQEDFYRAVKDQGIRFGKPRAGFHDKLGGVDISVLAPPEHLLSGTESDANNSSLVLLLTYGKVSFLLTGDMEQEERATVAHWPRVTVLKVAHHGSYNGTDARFAKALSPRFAVISYGKDNPYGHPHEAARQALIDVGAQLLETARDGTVTFTTDGKSVTCTTTADTEQEAK